MRNDLEGIPANPEYPIQLDIDYPDMKLNRWSCFFRLIIIIPILAILAILVGGSFHTWHHHKILLESNDFIFLATLVMIVLFKKYPKWWFDWNLELIRFIMRINAFMMLLTHEYPSTDQQQAVKLNIVYPQSADLNRFMPLVKWLLAIPHYIILFFLGLFVWLVTIYVWFVILFTARYPKKVFGFVVGVHRWSVRVMGYSFLLVTDKYPPFSIY